MHGAIGWMDLYSAFAALASGRGHGRGIGARSCLACEHCNARLCTGNRRAAWVAAIGALLIPRLKRTALRYQTTEQT